MIRWGRLLFLIVPLVLIWTGTHFFLDRGIKSALETAGTAANGARVDVRDVDTRFWQLSAVIRGLAVTDSDNPMTNTLEIDTLKFQMEMKPLFWRKFIVREAAITGIRTGTPRKKSGALPAAASAAKPEDSSVVEESKKIGGLALDNLKEAYDPKRLISTATLSSYRKVEAERARLTALSEGWKSRSKELDVKSLQKRTEDFVRQVKSEKFSGLEGVAKAQSLVKQAKDLQEDLKKAQKGFKDLKTDLTAEIKNGRETLKDIERLRKEDIQRVTGEVKAGLSAEGVIHGLIGPEWNRKLEKALGLLEKSRRLAPGGDDKKGDKKKEPASATATAAPTRGGEDIPFPFHYRWPAFHLKRAALTGQTPGDDPLRYQGELTDVTSDPALLGRPIGITIKGEDAPRSLNAEITLDFTKAVSRQKVQADYRGLPLKGIVMGQLKGPITLTDGSGGVAVNVTATGDALAGRIDLQGDHLRIQHAAGPDTDRVASLLHDTLIGIDQGEIGFGVSGTLRSPRFEMNTSLDDKIRSALKGAFDQQLARLRAEGEKRVKDLVDGEIQKLSQLVEKNGAGAVEQLGLTEKNLGGLEEQVNKTLNDLAGQGTKNLKLPDLKNLFKKK